MSSAVIRRDLSIKNAYIETLRPDHCEQLYELFELNRNYLRQHIPGVDLIQTREDLERRWITSKKNFMQFGLWLDNNQLIGRMRLTFNENSSSAHIGYWLSESYQGQGLMTAAVAEMVKIAFEKWNVQRVEICCGINNYKSRAIPERLGFRIEGLTSSEHAVELNGQMIQSIIYSKSNETLE